MFVLGILAFDLELSLADFFCCLDSALVGIREYLFLTPTDIDTSKTSLFQFRGGETVVASLSSLFADSHPVFQSMSR